MLTVFVVVAVSLSLVGVTMMVTEHTDEIEHHPEVNESLPMSQPQAIGMEDPTQQQITQQLTPEQKARIEETISQQISKTQNKD